MDEEKIEINRSKFKPLSKASHDKGINGRKVTTNNPSEWAWSWAVAQVPVGVKVTREEFKKKLLESVYYEIMSIMVEDGLAEMVMTKKGELAFLIREK